MFKKIEKLCSIFIIIFIGFTTFINLTLAQSQTTDATTNGSGLRCLNSMETYNLKCSTKKSLKTKTCKTLLERKKKLCSLKTLKCNSFDEIVCANNNQTYNNVCEIRKLSLNLKRRGQCTSNSLSCNGKYEPVCGLPTTCFNGNGSSLSKCPPQKPKIYDNICELKLASAALLEKKSCEGGPVSCVSDGIKVCGQRDSCFGKPLLGCTNVFYRPEWFEDKCSLLKAGATLLSDQECGGSIKDCSLNSGQVCGLLNPECYQNSEIDGGGRKICKAIASRFLLFKNSCEALSANAQIVDLSNCQRT